MRAARRGSGNGRVTRGSGGSARRGGRGTGRGLGGSATKGAAVGVMAGGPASTVGALIDRTLVPVVSEAMARVASLVVTRVSGGEGDL